MATSTSSRTHPPFLTTVTFLRCVWFCSLLTLTAVILLFSWLRGDYFFTAPKNSKIKNCSYGSVFQDIPVPHIYTGDIYCGTTHTFRSTCIFKHAFLTFTSARHLTSNTLFPRVSFSHRCVGETNAFSLPPILLPPGTDAAHLSSACGPISGPMNQQQHPLNNVTMRISTAVGTRNMNELPGLTEPSIEHDRPARCSLMSWQFLIFRRKTIEPHRILPAACGVRFSRG